MTIHWKAVEQYFTVVLFLFQTVCNFTKKFSNLDYALSGVKGLRCLKQGRLFCHKPHTSSPWDGIHLSTWKLNVSPICAEKYVPVCWSGPLGRTVYLLRGYRLLCIFPLRSYASWKVNY